MYGPAPVTRTAGPSFENVAPSQDIRPVGVAARRRSVRLTTPESASDASAAIRVLPLVWMTVVPATGLVTVASGGVASTLTRTVVVARQLAVARPHSHVIGARDQLVRSEQHQGTGAPALGQPAASPSRRPAGVLEAVTRMGR